ncbi:MAG: diguanylate cyclase (GGDEF)-like protein [Paraglaciecola sp.]
MTISNRNEFFYPILAIASIIILLWQHFGLNKSLEIFPNPINKTVMLNDGISGGNSTGTIKNIDDVLQLDCQTVKSSNTFAFCSAMLPIDKNGKGVDLTSYQTLDIWLELVSDSKDTVIIYLLNHEPDAGDEELKRANHVTIYPSEGMQHYRLKLDKFYLPSWWLFAYADDMDNGEPNIDNVTDIQISTGDNAFERSETIRIQGIAISGKWLSSQHLYIFLVIVWTSLIFIDGFMALRRARKKLTKSRVRAKELRKITKFLSIEKEKYKSMAKVDHLTKALNRAGLRDILDHVVQQYVENKVPCSVIMFDIDRFKLVNDSFGHNAGDEVLIELVARVKNHIRKNDCLARWGGEEFVLVCPDTNFDVAIKIAEKHRVDIASTHFSDHPITCSFGVANLTSKGISKCFEEADLALYRAKNKGRNQVAY